MEARENLEVGKIKTDRDRPRQGRTMDFSCGWADSAHNKTMQRSDWAGLSILIVEDETLLRKQIVATLERLGADLFQAATLAAARKLLGEFNFDFVLLDVNLPDGLGTDLLREKSFSTDTEVIVMTAEGGVAGVVEAMRLGAVDFLAKPFDPVELPLVISRARRGRQSARVREHRTRQEGAFFFGTALAGLEKHLHKIVTADKRMEEFLPPVLIQGETGTGKTTIARWLHRNGPRASFPFVEVNCSALPESLAESELFGHERGAFTDARLARMGLFEAADGGTLFLDELPSLSLALQAKVLKVIEDHKIRRLGAQKELMVDVRLIAASNQDVRELAGRGQFREDLLHRLDLYRVDMPPLRTRGEDIFRLAESMAERLCHRHRVPVRKITAEGRENLLHHAWPGNVRELAHELEREIIFSEDTGLNFSHLKPASGRQADRTDEPDWFNDSYQFPERGFQLEKAVERLIAHAMKQTGNNVSATARLLGVSRDYIRYRVENGKGKGGEQTPAGPGSRLGVGE